MSLVLNESFSGVVCMISLVPPSMRYSACFPVHVAYKRFVSGLTAMPTFSIVSYSMLVGISIEALCSKVFPSYTSMLSG